jgi:hypothetical protein
MRYPSMAAFPAIGNPDFLAVASDRFLAATVTHGRPGRRMPAWGEKLEIDGQVLFRLRGAESLPAEVRAAGVKARIVELAADPTVRTTDLRVETSGEYVRVMAGDRAAVTLVDADAQLMRVSLTVLAELSRLRIAQAIEEYRQARRPEQLLRDAVAALAATLALPLAVVLVVWLTRRLDVRLERRFHRRIKALELQSFELVRAEQIEGALRTLLRGLRTVALLALALLYLHFVLALFPWTRGYADRLLEVVLGSVTTMGRALLATVPNLVFLAVLFLVIRFVLRALRLFFDAVGRGSITLRGFDREWAVPTYKMARLAVIAFGLVVAYPSFLGRNRRRSRASRSSSVSSSRSGRPPATRRRGGRRKPCCSWRRTARRGC